MIDRRSLLKGTGALAATAALPGFMSAHAQSMQHLERDMFAEIIAKYGPSKDAQPKEAQRKFANSAKGLFTRQWEATHPNKDTGNMNALHRLDMVAGGDPTDFADMGDAKRQSVSWAGVEGRQSQRRVEAPCRRNV